MLENAFQAAMKKLSVADILFGSHMRAFMKNLPGILFD